MHLVDKPATIERFTEELLLDPRPPPHWQQQLVAAPVEHEALPVAGPSSGLNRGQNLLEVWEGERFEQLKSMFPDVCPEHLLSRVQGISAAKERVGEEVTGADHHKCSWYSNSGGGGCQEYLMIINLCSAVQHL